MFAVVNVPRLSVLENLQVQLETETEGETEELKSNQKLLLSAQQKIVMTGRDSFRFAQDTTLCQSRLLTSDLI